MTPKRARDEYTTKLDVAQAVELLDCQPADNRKSLNFDADVVKMYMDKTCSTPEVKGRMLVKVAEDIGAISPFSAPSDLDTALALGVRRLVEDIKPADKMGRPSKTNSEVLDLVSACLSLSLNCDESPLKRDSLLARGRKELNLSKGNIRRGWDITTRIRNGAGYKPAPPTEASLKRQAREEEEAANFAAMNHDTNYFTENPNVPSAHVGWTYKFEIDEERTAAHPKGKRVSHASSFFCRHFLKPSPFIL
jgi:hypothetical protein